MRTGIAFENDAVVFVRTSGVSLNKSSNPMI